jgi:hypothetical protein
MIRLSNQTWRTWSWRPDGVTKLQHVKSASWVPAMCRALLQALLMKSVHQPANIAAAATKSISNPVCCMGLRTTSSPYAVFWKHSHCHWCHLVWLFEKSGISPSVKRENQALDSFLQGSHITQSDGSACTVSKVGLPLHWICLEGVCLLLSWLCGPRSCPPQREWVQKQPHVCHWPSLQGTKSMSYSFFLCICDTSPDYFVEFCEDQMRLG